MAFSLRGRAALAQRGAALVKWDDRFELAVDFEINRPEGGRRYNRPYVAVWIEDAAGKPVRTLSVWVQNSGRGPRWIRELRRWFRAAQERRSTGGSDLVATVSSATRMPGAYTVLWNGRNDDGDSVEQGDYAVLIEAAREHGSYQLMRQEVTLATRPFQTQVEGNVEIKGATIEFRQRK
jgi:hypothetical protein